MQVTISPITISGVKYISVREMAILTNKSDQTIYNLISKGNTIRKMKSTKVGATVMIPYIEVIEFPFTNVGKNAKDNIYHYNYNGQIVEN